MGSSSSFHFGNSPSKNVLLHFSNSQTKTDEPYSSDGWTFDENKIFENCFAEFDAKDCPELFEKVAQLLPHKSMPSLHAHYKTLMTDMELIETLSNNYCEHDTNTGSVVAIEQPMENHNVSRRPKKMGVPWTIEEHKLFLIGLEVHGKGQWKKIAEEYVTSRTPAQVASHYQKFMNRVHCNTPPAKRKFTINDLKTVEECNFPSYPEINPQLDALGIFGAPHQQQMQHN